MSGKIGYTVMTLQDYDELIKENKELELENKELRAENSSIEQAILERVYDTSNYEMKNYTGTDDYYHKSLVDTFKAYGYTDMDKINKFITKLMEKYNVQKENENE